jgi:SAM-dependent methyltransferase
MDGPPGVAVQGILGLAVYVEFVRRQLMPTRARYDSYAGWYDEHLPSFARRATPLITAWLGPGPGRCLELGCGGGLHLTPLAEAGWFVVGLDISASQLAVAKRRRRITCLVRGDVASLPFADRSFDAAFAAFIQTDVDDWSGTAAEAARVVRPGGRVVCVGTHPCFVGPFSRSPAGVPPQLFPGYRRTERTHTGPGLGNGLRRRVGVRHVPLAALINALLESGLQVERVDEPGPEDYPRILAIKAARR